MIKISQAEFENKIQELLDGKNSRMDLIKELETDIRTLNNEIIKRLSVYNVDLYLEYIKKYPYKQKERDDLDYEALVIEGIKTQAHTIDLANKYNVGVRTIQRKVDKLKKENPDLISLYKAVKKNNRNQIALTSEMQEQIAQLVERPVIISEQNENRRKKLEDIERIFNNRCQYYQTKQEAANSMGMSMSVLFKLLSELYRIRIEEDHIKMDNSFKERIKAEGQISVKNNIDQNIVLESKTINIEIEGEEK